MATITKICILSVIQLTCQLVVGLIILESTYSRYERTPVNIFFLSIVGSNQRLWISNYHGPSAICERK